MASSAETGAGPRTQGAGGLDLLAGASLPVVNPWLPGKGSIRAVGRLARRPRRVASRVAGTGAELARVATGRSHVAPAADRRFREPAWSGNALLRALAQAYLVLCESADQMVMDAELDWQAEHRVRLALENLGEALAPTNFPWSNPAVLKAILDTGGGNLATGVSRMVRDLVRTRTPLPTISEERDFELGRDLAATTGAVVARTPLFELLQYRPSTAEVHEVPVVLVASVINKFYVVDLSPGRSLVEYLRDAGFTVFAVSWRNPGEHERDWNLETYTEGVLDVLDLVRRITRAEAANVMGLCAGGIVVAAAAAVLAQRGQLDRLAGLTLGVSALDQEHAGEIGALVDRRTASIAIADSARRGYVEGRAMVGVFAWLRPYERIWRHWIDTYLLAKDHSAFDIVFWAEDHTNLAAGMHRDLLELALGNTMARRGGLLVLGEPVDLRRVTSDGYVVAGLTDHITPWQNCLRAAGLLGAMPRFVVAAAGHVAAIVHPPGGRGGYWAGPAGTTDGEAWLNAARQAQGSWWSDWIEWLDERSGALRKAPRRLGARGLPPLEAAPGSYVR